tara:strand:+ start:229 stop:495 length:267 start_codon:yes stop_codon:yes gene_type:complete
MVVGQIKLNGRYRFYSTCVHNHWDNSKASILFQRITWLQEHIAGEPILGIEVDIQHKSTLILLLNVINLHELGCLFEEVLILGVDPLL